MISADDFIKSIAKLIDGYNDLASVVETNQKAIITLASRLEAVESSALPERVLLLEKWVAAREPEATKSSEPDTGMDELVERCVNRIVKEVEPEWGEDEGECRQALTDILRSFAEEVKKA